MVRVLVRGRMNICEISIAYSPVVRKINGTNRARVWIKILPVAAGTHNPLSGGIISEMQMGIIPDYPRMGISSGYPRIPKFGEDTHYPGIPS